ncbi:hypothetical protein NC651_001949 [Populus alba x Populus x berolinensis]|nr:hypothetical protein NC651_001949 [Populus alba x Populus x berolinensis]
MGIFILGGWWMVCHMGRGSICGVMGVCMKESGGEGRLMEVGSFLGHQELLMKVSLS